MTTTLGAAIAATTARDPARPLLTWYDDATRERTELSGVTLENWVAKTANLLVDGAGLGEGDVAGAPLPPHWQTAAVLLGCWTAGLAVVTAPAPVDVLFAAGPAEGWSAIEQYAVSLHPLALPLRSVPPGWSDFALEVRGHGDRFVPPTTVAGTEAALDGADHGEVLARAAARATALGIRAGTRVLIDVTAHPDPVDWLLAPMTAGASIVACAHLDPAGLDARLAAENAIPIHR